MKIVDIYKVQIDSEDYLIAKSDKGKMYSIEDAVAVSLLLSGKKLEFSEHNVNVARSVLKSRDWDKDFTGIKEALIKGFTKDKKISSIKIKNNLYLKNKVKKEDNEISM